MGVSGPAYCAATLLYGYMMACTMSGRTGRLSTLEDLNLSACRKPTHPHWCTDQKHSYLEVTGSDRYMNLS
jgi:hypothetical protein